jgi:hypothetical protein
MTVNRTSYRILGVHPHESQAGIRSAFHHLALRYHPDRAGPRGTPLFQELVEAYLTLSDPTRREDYDRGLGHHEAREAAPTVRVAGPRAPVESLVPEPLVPENIGFLGDVAVTRPPASAVRQRLRARYAAEPRPRRTETLEVEVALDPDLAWRGGRPLDEATAW